MAYSDEQTDTQRDKQTGRVERWRVTHTDDPFRGACAGDGGSIKPHQRGQCLGHPIGDHGHGAEHRANLQERNAHVVPPAGRLALVPPTVPGAGIQMQRENGHEPDASSSLFLQPRDG